MSRHRGLYATETEEGRGTGVGLQRGGRQFKWRWENKCLVNKCSAGPCRDSGTLERTSVSKPCPHILCRYLW